MKRVLTFFWVMALVLAAAFVSTAQAATRFEIKQMIIEEASDSMVPVELALAVAKVESDFNAKALSSAGARGVMQIMPDTARGEFGVNARRLWNPETNIRIGVEFLEQLHDQYDGRWDLALSHYNGGTVKGSKPHTYTLQYIARVQKWQKIYQEQASLWDSGPLDKWQEEDDNLDTAELRTWRKRADRDDYYDDFDDDEFYEDDYDARIIIVERGGGYDRGWRRPPPPPRDRFNHRRPPPRHFGRHFR